MSNETLLDGSYEHNLNSTSEVAAGDEIVTIIQATVLSLLFLIAAVGNGVLIYLYGRDHRMWTTTNKLVMSHIAAEFAASVVGILMYVSIFARRQKQRSVSYEESLCIFVGSVNIFFFCGSFLSLTSICVDRYLAVVKGIHHRLTHNRVQLALGLVWTQSLISSIPWDLAASRPPQRYLAWLLSNCHYEYPTSDQTTSSVITGIILAIITFYLPTIAVLYTCFHILRAALRSRSQVHVIGTFSNRIAAAYSRSAFTTLIIITVYFLCIVPSAVLYFFVKTDSRPHHYPQSNYVIAKVALSFRSACYPIIYGVRNEKFFRYVRKLLTTRLKLSGCTHVFGPTGEGTAPQFCPDNECHVLWTPKQRTIKSVSQAGAQSSVDVDQHSRLWSRPRKLAFVDLEKLPPS